MGRFVGEILWVENMARSINKLTAKKVSSLSEKGRYSDGNGLWLQITQHGTKSWLYRFMMHGRARQMGLGSISTVSLADAREAVANCRKMVQQGIDPIQQREEEVRTRKLEIARAMTFKECALAFLSDNSDGWKNAKHRQQWENTLKTYAYPVIGDFLVKQIDTDLVVKVLQPIWKEKTETASRVRGRIERVLDWAKVRGYRDGENPARWRGHLDKVFPKASALKNEKHFAALPYKEIASFMAELQKRDGNAARGLEFQILTAARPGEVYEMTWEEIDLQNKIWIVPAERMKAKREHRVPLSDRAVKLLENLPREKDSPYVFNGHKKGRPLSNAAFSQLMKRMGMCDITAHGFRSTFRDWAAEQTSFPHEICEMALAHTIKNKAEAAYRRGDLLEKRRELMEAWAGVMK